MPKIKVLQRYRRLIDARLIASAGAAIQGLAESALANIPVDLKVVQTAVDNLNAAIAAQPHGGAAATAHKNNQREVLIGIMEKLAHHVQDNCGGDPAVVLKAGFTVATYGRVGSPLEKPSIAGIDFGKSTELVVRIKRVAKATSYELRMAALDAGGVPGPWSTLGFFTKTRAITVKDLTRLTTYTFQARAIGPEGATDWGDPSQHICL